MLNKYEIDILNANQRLDKFLFRLLPNAPKSFVYKLVRTKDVKLNGKRAMIGDLLKDGDVVGVYLSEKMFEEMAREKEVGIKDAADLSLVYEDENIIVCHKPQGVLTHPERAGDKDTIVDRALSHVAKSGAIQFEPVCANRLDRNTSGIIIVAKNLPSAQWLAEVFRSRAAEKIYFCVAHGVIEEKTVIKDSLAKDAKLNKAFKSDEGREAVTEIEPVRIDRKNEFTVLKVKLITGRTHQIRAHLSGIGHPIVGDAKYGGKRNIHKFPILHAYSIVFEESDGFLGYLCGRVFVSELPKIFGKFSEK